MKVKLLKDVYEADRFGNETIKVTRRRGRSIPWVEGRVFEMSNASAQKYIDSGKGEEVPEEVQETEDAQ